MFKLLLKLYRWYSKIIYIKLILILFGVSVLLFFSYFEEIYSWLSCNDKSINSVSDNCEVGNPWLTLPLAIFCTLLLSYCIRRLMKRIKNGKQIEETEPKEQSADDNTSSGKETFQEKRMQVIESSKKNTNSVIQK